ncbi:MAG: tetratricopeptide repeat protein [Gammaproteobacteria bacterium]|nr:tetratricopeptide repeat protein [Gammaproteobacteria bacterium]
MNTFIILTTVMLMMALLIVGWPLVRDFGKQDADHRKTNLVGGLAVMLLVPALSAALYSRMSTWDWDSPVTNPVQGAQTAPHPTEAGDMSAMVNQLKARLESDGGSPADWVLLGRSYMQAGDFPAALEVFDKALTLGGDKDSRVLVQIGQALVEMDESSLNGTAGEMFEQALVLTPDDPASLWWSGYAALANNRPADAKTRWSKLLGLNPPENIAQILTDQIAMIDGQVGGSAAVTQTVGAGTEAGVKATPSMPVATQAKSEAVPEGKVALHVSLDPALNLSGLNGPATIFVIARPAGVAGGPPLAVVRRSTADLPATILLGDENAMIAGTTLTGVEELQFTARISLSGGRTAAPGDLFGQINYRWTNGNSVDLVINTLVK